MPMTEPPEKATANARFMPPSRAACAVRTLARVATRMPKKPARIEKSAPATKQTAVIQSIKKPISRSSAVMKTARILYSDFKKASAPSAMAAAISCMRSVPGLALETKAALLAAKSSAQSARTGVIQTNTCIRHTLLNES